MGRELSEEFSERRCSHISVLKFKIWTTARNCEVKLRRRWQGKTLAQIKVMAEYS